MEVSMHLSENQCRTLCVSAVLPEHLQRLDGEWGIHQFEVVEELYRGKTTQLSKAVDKTSQAVVAIKQYRKKSLSVLNRYQVEREVQIHINLLHKHIIRLYAVFEDPAQIYLVQEFAPGGDLFEALKHQTDMRFSEEEAAVRFIAPCVEAIAYLQQQGIIHRDIKPENILLDEGGQVKLADFGLAINMKQERPVTRAGTLDYMAPEVLVCPDKKLPQENKDKLSLGYGSQVDVWALGCLAAELVTGSPPFEAESRSMTYQMIMYREPCLPAYISEAARAFITASLAKSPVERSTVSHMLQHEWLISHSRPAAMPAISAHGGTDSMVQVVGGLTDSSKEQQTGSLLCSSPTASRIQLTVDPTPAAPNDAGSISSTAASNRAARICTSHDADIQAATVTAAPGPTATATIPAANSETTRCDGQRLQLSANSQSDSSSKGHSTSTAATVQTLTTSYDAGSISLQAGQQASTSGKRGMQQAGNRHSAAEQQQQQQSNVAAAAVLAADEALGVDPQSELADTRATPGLCTTSGAVANSIMGGVAVSIPQTPHSRSTRDIQDKRSRASSTHGHRLHKIFYPHDKHRRSSHSNMHWEEEMDSRAHSFIMQPAAVLNRGDDNSAAILVVDGAEQHAVTIVHQQGVSCESNFPIGAESNQADPNSSGASACSSLHSSFGDSHQRGQVTVSPVDDTAEHGIETRPGTCAFGVHTSSAPEQVPAAKAVPGPAATSWTPLTHTLSSVGRDPGGRVHTLWFGVGDALTASLSCAPESAASSVERCGVAGASSVNSPKSGLESVTSRGHSISSGDATGCEGLPLLTPRHSKLHGGRSKAASTLATDNKRVSRVHTSDSPKHNRAGAASAASPGETDSHVGTEANWASCSPCSSTACLGAAASQFKTAPQFACQPGRGGHHRLDDVHSVPCSPGRRLMWADEMSTTSSKVKLATLSTAAHELLDEPGGNVSLLSPAGSHDWGQRDGGGFMGTRSNDYGLQQTTRRHTPLQQLQSQTCGPALQASCKVVAVADSVTWKATSRTHSRRAGCLSAVSSPSQISSSVELGRWQQSVNPSEGSPAAQPQLQTVDMPVRRRVSSSELIGAVPSPASNSLIIRHSGYIADLNFVDSRPSSACRPIQAAVPFDEAVMVTKSSNRAPCIGASSKQWLLSPTCDRPAALANYDTVNDGIAGSRRCVRSVNANPRQVDEEYWPPRSSGALTPSRVVHIDHRGFEAAKRGSCPRSKSVSSLVDCQHR